MNTSFSDQIRAIQTARKGASMLVRDEDISEFDKALNDAASTIAALNLTKDLPKPADQSREEYLTTLENLVADWLEFWNDGDKEKILAMSFDRIRQLENELGEANLNASYWEKMWKKAFPGL